MKTTAKAFLAAACILSCTFAGAASYLKMDNDFGADFEKVQTSPLFRKKIAFIGDSYVQNHHRPIAEAWHALLAQKYLMHYLNYGRNGNRMVFAHPKQGETMLVRYREIPADADYIVVIAGHNDASAIARLNGKDDADREEPGVKERQAEMLAGFREGCGKMLDGLKQHYPNAKVALISPWRVERPFFADVIAVEKEECQKRGIAFCDSSELTGIAPNDEATRKNLFQGAKDTAHLNAAGHKLVLPKFESFLLSL